LSSISAGDFKELPFTCCLVNYNFLISWLTCGGVPATPLNGGVKRGTKGCESTLIRSLSVNIVNVRSRSVICKS
jgi:hypothetical protein